MKGLYTVSYFLIRSLAYFFILLYYVHYCISGFWIWVWIIGVIIGILYRAFISFFGFDLSYFNIREQIKLHYFVKELQRCFWTSLIELLLWNGKVDNFLLCLVIMIFSVCFLVLVAGISIALLSAYQRRIHSIFIQDT